VKKSFFGGSKMKPALMLAALWILTTNLAFASSGGVDGGGGKGVVCRNKSGKITSAEALDLYEGRVMWGLNIKKSTAPMEQQIQHALAVIPETSRLLIESRADIILKKMRLTPPGTQLLPVEDSFEVLLPRGCAGEQLANYYNDNLILISGDIWAQLSQTDRAALILHEAVYAVNRMAQASDSRQSRHVVANIFADGTQWVDVRDQLPEDALTCISDSGGVLMWAYKNSSDEWVLQFQLLGNGFVMSKKWITLPSEDFDFNEAKDFPLLTGDDLIGNSINTGEFAHSAFEVDDFISVTKKWEAIKDVDGNPLKGFQTIRYYLGWTSGTFPMAKFEDHALNCSMELLP
jgi:hypothetical protein